jgi:hypothetical protein
MSDDITKIGHAPTSLFIENFFFLLLTSSSYILACVSEVIIELKIAKKKTTLLHVESVLAWA